MVLSPLKNQNHKTWKTTKTNHSLLPINLKKCCPSLQSKMVGEGRSYEDLDPATLVSQEVKSVP